MGFLNTDSQVVQFFNKFADLVLLNFLWMIFSIPIVTIGAATTAMYYVSIRSIRYGDGYVISRFLKSFKENFRQSTIIWLIMLVLGYVFAIDFNFWSNFESQISKGMLIISGFFFFFYVLILLYIFPIQAKFNNPIKINLKNSLAMAIGSLPQTTIILILCMVWLYANYTTFAANILSLIFGIALLSYVLSFFYCKVFCNYIEDESIEEVDGKRIIDK